MAAEVGGGCSGFGLSEGGGCSLKCRRKGGGWVWVGGGFPEWIGGLLCKIDGSCEVQPFRW